MQACLCAKDFAWVQVPLHVIDEVACEEDKSKYQRYRLRSFVEDNRLVEWCPAPDCEFAVEALVDLHAEPMDVACTCGSTFCFTCKEEAHRPVSLDNHLRACDLVYSLRMPAVILS